MTDIGGSSSAELGADSTADEDERRWYEQPASYAAAALLGVIAIVVIVVLAVSADDGDGSTVTTAGTSTTVVTDDDEEDCREGDAEACEELDGRTLGDLCDDGVEIACQEVFNRLEDQSPPTTSSTPETTVSPSEPLSDTDRCRAGDSAACSRLGDASIDGLCADGVAAACAEADARGEAGRFNTPVGQCELGDPTACAQISNAELAGICPDPAADPSRAACAELAARGGG